MHGQKGFNGVALLSKLRFDEVTPGLAGDADDVQARYLEAVVSVPSGVLRLLNIYLPNGNPVGTEKYRLQARLDGAAARAGEGAARARGAA